MNQHSRGRYVVQLGHIIRIPNKSVFALSPKCCMLGGEATNTNFIACGLTQPDREHTVYHTRSAHVNHYTIDVVARLELHALQHVYFLTDILFYEIEIN